MSSGSSDQAFPSWRSLRRWAHIDRRRDRIPGGVHVEVDRRDELVHRRPAPLAQSGGDGLLAGETVCQQRLDLGSGVLQDRAVPGGDGLDRGIEVQETAEAVEVLRHVAVGRGDDDRRAAHDVIAGQHEPPLHRAVAGSGLLDQVAKVIRGVPGRMQGPQPDGAELEDVAVSKLEVRHEAVAGVVAAELSPAPGREGGRPGGVVGMGVGDEDVSDPAARRALDPIQVCLVQRSRVDGCHDVVADEVGVRSRAGHDRRIRGRDALDVGVDLIDDARDRCARDRCARAALLSHGRPRPAGPGSPSPAADPSHRRSRARRGAGTARPLRPP